MNRRLMPFLVVAIMLLAAAAGWITFQSYRHQPGSANAVVTKNVAPYTIVAGNPARLIRPRFPAAIAERLMALAWWDWPATTIFEAIPDIQSLSIEDFLAKWER